MALFNFRPIFVILICLLYTFTTAENEYIRTMNAVMNSKVILGRQHKLMTSETKLDTNILKQLDLQGLVLEKGSDSSSSLQATAGEYNVSEVCQNDFNSMVSLAGQQELWAVGMIDSWAKPPSGILVGNTKWYASYDECVDIEATVQRPNSTEIASRFNGQYCYVQIPVSLLTQNPLIRAVVPRVDTGVCVPDTCSSRDTMKLMYELFQSIIPPNSGFYAWSICEEKDKSLDTRAIVAIVIISILGLMMVIGTAYDVIFIQWPNYNKSSRSRKNTSVELYPEEKKPLIETAAVGTTSEPGLAESILLAFSVYTNTKKIFSTKQGSGALTSINGIRFLSMAWVILGHTYQFCLGNASNKNTVYPQYIGRWTFQAIVNALVSVDTFFALSGLLLAYLVLREMESKNGKINWFMFYFHRFWRLTPPYMLVLMFYSTLTYYLSDGPYWPQTKFDGICDDNWWKNLLYINNFWKMGDMCMAWAWYLANDMQFYIISPLMLLPLYYFNILGIVVCIFFLGGSWIATGVISTLGEMPPSAFGGGPPTTNSDYTDLYYIRPYTRIGPYIIGIMAGYILYRTKCKIYIKWYLNITGWVIAAGLACLILYGLHDPLNGDTLSKEVSALYNTTHRTIWGACVCWVIFACATGNGGFINTFLSWSAFVPLGRLTYCAYLVHPIVLSIYYNSLREPVYMTDLTMIYQFIGHLVASNMVAFVTSLTFEAPMMGLEKAIFKRNKSS